MPATKPPGSRKTALRAAEPQLSMRQYSLTASMRPPASGAGRNPLRYVQVRVLVAALRLLG